jgi:hypothetical protein
MASNVAVEEKNWKAIWKIKAPRNMLIHLWHFAHGCVPSGTQLCKRQIPADSACIFCGREEGIVYLILPYQFARTVWREIKDLISMKLKRNEPIKRHLLMLFDQ